MNDGKTVFAQLMSFLPDYQFNKCVDRYNGNYRVRKFPCREHFYVMCFSQLTYRESLRDIEACLIALSNKLYRSGIKHPASRTTLAEANENRDWRIYADFAQVLSKDAQQLYKSDNEFLLELDGMAYALDSTTIDLCLALFPWAKFRKAKGAIKLHTLINLRGSIPTFIEITDGTVHDVNILDLITFEPGAFYVMDMAYVSFQRLFRIHNHQAFFVSRAQQNLAYERVYSRKVDKTLGLRCDQSIRLKSFYPKKDYPELIRRIKYFDKETLNTYDFLTNNFELDAFKIAQLYKERWKVELFFKWIKQHLRIKSFYGTSRNAVFSQIWIAISAYLLIAIVKKRLNLNHSLYTLLQIFSLSLFEKMPINQLFTNSDYNLDDLTNPNQLTLFDL
jgi:hypothetical protein